MTRKRKIEVFVANCPLCDDTVHMVNEVTCPDCYITVYNLTDYGEKDAVVKKARKYGVDCVPSVVVDGQLLDPCKRGKLTKEDLRAAGISTPL
jgi:hypothetical protein